MVFSIVSVAAVKWKVMNTAKTMLVCGGGCLNIILLFLVVAVLIKRKYRFFTEEPREKSRERNIKSNQNNNNLSEKVRSCSANQQQGI